MKYKILPTRQKCDLDGICKTSTKYKNVCKGKVRLDFYDYNEVTHGCPWRSGGVGLLTIDGIENIHNLTATERYLDISTRAKEDKIYGMSSTEIVS